MRVPDKRCWAEISLKNILHNYRAIRAVIPESCRFLGVVKADAYGHGAIQTALLLEEAGADYLAVACLDEALELRGAGVKMPVLILGHTEAAYTRELIENSITQAVTGLEEAKAFSAAAQEVTLPATSQGSRNSGRTPAGSPERAVSSSDHFRFAMS